MLDLVRIAAATTLLLVCAGVARPARAQTETELAAAYSDQAAQAYASGNLAEAVRLYEAAFELVEDPSFAYNLGALNDELGNPAWTYNWFRRYVEIFPGAEDRADIEAYLSELLEDVQRNFTLVVATSNPSRARAYLIDNEGHERLLGRTPFELWVEPGDLHIEFRLDGYNTVVEDLRGVPGVRVAPDVRLAEASEVEPGPDTTPVPEEGSGEAAPEVPMEEGDGSGMRTAGWVLGGTGAVAVISGVVLWALGEQAESERNDLISGIDPGEAVSRRRIDSLEDEARSDKRLGNIAFFSGLGLVGAGAALILISPGAEEERANGASSSPVSVAPMTDAWGLVFAGRF